MNIHSVRQPDGRFAPSEKQAARRVEIWLDPETLKAVDAAAQQGGIGRGKAIAQLITADHQRSEHTASGPTPTASGAPPEWRDSSPTTSGPTPITGGPLPITGGASSNDSVVWKALTMAFAIGAQVLGETLQDSLEEGQAYEVAEGVRQEVLDRLAEDCPGIPLQVTGVLSDFEVVWFEVLVARLLQNVEVSEKRQQAT